MGACWHLAACEHALGWHRHGAEYTPAPVPRFVMHPPFGTAIAFAGDGTELWKRRGDAEARVAGPRADFSDLGGSVYSARLDGSARKTLAVAQRNLTGIAYAELPVRRSPQG